MYKPATIKKICIALLLLLTASIHAQTLKIKNIHHRIIDDKIEIFYDLPKNNDSLMVTVVFHKTSSPKFKYYPKFIEGDVGEGVFSGITRKAVWHYKKEPAWLFTGKGFYFKVYAAKKQKGAVN